MTGRSLMIIASLAGVVIALLVFNFSWVGWFTALIPFASCIASANMPEQKKREVSDTDLQLIQAYESDDLDAVFAVIKLRKWLRRYS